MRQCPKCGKRFLTDHVRVCDEDGSALQTLLLASSKDRLLGTTVLEVYKVDGILGDGGMGVVYRATHTRTGKLYAIKVLRAEYSSEEDLVNRFQQEAESVRDIHHPHIIEVFQFGGLEDGSRFFVMEYLEGRSLGQLLTAQPRKPGRERRRALPEMVTLHIGAQICEGLAAAHERGIVHRDMKPDNVHLVTRGDDENFVKILDFGIAKVQGSKSARTRTGSVFGTPHYMSPEQASGERDIDPRTDVYALGVLLYEMSTGKVPFDAENLMGILTAHLYHPPVPPREHPEAAEMSDGLEAVILKALSKRRENRYESMADLREELLRVARGERPLAMEMDERTGLYRRPQPSGEYDGVSGGKLTVPEGRISRSSIPAGIDLLPSVEITQIYDGPVSEHGGDTGDLPGFVPSVPVGTNRSIPPITANTNRPGSLVPPGPGAAQGRPRGAIIALLFGTGTVLFLAAAVVLGTRRSDVNATQASTTGPRTVMPAPSEPPVLAPPQGTVLSPVAPSPSPSPSPTIMLVSDPAGANVFRGRERVGVTPMPVPRPASGEVTYALAAEGRMRTPIVVRASTGSEVQVVLPRGATARPTPGGAQSGHPDLLDPWATNPQR